MTANYPPGPPWNAGPLPPPQPPQPGVHRMPLFPPETDPSRPLPINQTHNTAVGDGGGGKPKRKKRIFMWVFLVVQVLFLIWLISSLTGQNEAVDSTCTGLSGAELSDCRDAAGAGAAIGSGIAFFLVLFLWMMVDVILGVIYMITRRRS